MLTNQEIIAFVAGIDEPLTRSFYEDTLGLALVAEEPALLVFRSHGIMLRVSILPALKPAAYTVLGWRVADIQASVRALAERGVRFEHFPAMSQDNLGICHFPNGDRVAWFTDPAGNILSLTQFAT